MVKEKWTEKDEENYIKSGYVRFMESLPGAIITVEDKETKEKNK